MGRILLACFAAALVGCGASDPCDGKSGGTCITLHLESTRVTQLSQLRIATQVGSDPVEERDTPLTAGETFDLPLDLAIVYPPTQRGLAAIAVAAVTSSEVSAEGDAAFTLTPGQHRRVTVQLDLPPDTSTPDLAAPPDMAPAATATQVVSGSFDSMSSSTNLLVTVSHTNQTLQVWDATSGGLQATLDSNFVGSYRVQDNAVLYCTNPVAIGSTGNTSCTLKLWTPGSTTARQLGTGVYPWSDVVLSSDAAIVAWPGNVNATGTNADLLAVTSVGGTVGTFATQMPLANFEAGVAGANGLFAIVPGASAGQVDIVRLPGSVHICQNCDQFLISADATTIAARAAVSNGVGKLVVGATTLNSSNALGTSATAGPNGDVSMLAAIFPGSAMYTTSGSNLVELTLSNNAVATRVSNGSVKGVWTATASWLAYYTTVDANGAADLQLLPPGSGSPVAFDSGGVLHDVLADGHFVFIKEPSTTTSTWYVEVGNNVSSTKVAKLNAPSFAARLADATHLAFFTGTSTFDFGDLTVGTSFEWSNVTAYSLQRSRRRVLMLSPGDGIYAYSY